MNGFDDEWLRQHQARVQRSRLQLVTAPPLVPPTQAPAAQRAQTKRPEQSLQIAAIVFLDAALPREWRVMHAANGGHRSGAEAGIFKAMGVRPGYPDLAFVGKFGRIVLAEAKADRGRLTPKQEEWRDWCLQWSIPWFLFRSIDELIAGCTDAGIPLRTRQA